MDLGLENKVVFITGASFVHGAHVPIDGGQRKVFMDIPEDG
jgi:hypothetical protein